MKVKHWLMLLGVISTAGIPGFNQTVSAQTNGAIPKQVGLQLYSLRAAFGKNVTNTLDEVQGWGITHVETAGTYNVPPAEFKKLLADRGITAVSGHFGYDQFRDHIDDVIAQAKALGLKYAGCAWVPHKGAFNEKDTLETAEVFNKAGKALAKEHIQFFYHTHGYEFEPYKNETLFDLLVKKTDKKYVTFEMDIFWIVFPGQDPVALLKKYPGRFQLVHLKDMNKDLKTGSLAGGTDVKNDVTLGTGQVPVAEVIKTGQKTGVKWYFIEDESPTSEQQIPQSLKFLEAQAW